jgi:ComF family protein
MHALGPPRLCGACRRALAPLEAPCPRCAEPLRGLRCAPCALTPPPFRHARALFLYAPGGPGRSAIQRWKSGRDRLLGEALARYFASRFGDVSEHYDALVPVPGGHLRRAWRGFETAVVLCQALARRSPGVPMLLGALRRGRSFAPRLRRRSRAMRHREAKSLYRAGPLSFAPGSRILIVDDVMTSQASARAATAVLLAAGASLVDVAVLARAPVPTQGSS